MMRVNDILLSWAVFTWVLLLFFGTLDIAGFITDGHWYRLVVVAVIVGSISGIYLIMKRGHDGGFSYVDFAGLLIASIAIGGGLAIL